jgi:hypothetical protein
MEDMIKVVEEREVNQENIEIEDYLIKGENAMKIAQSQLEHL